MFAGCFQWGYFSLIILREKHMSRRTALLKGLNAQKHRGFISKANESLRITKLAGLMNKWPL